MRQGAAHLIGEHDFKSCCKAASAEGKTTMRRVDEISSTHEEQICRLYTAERGNGSLIELDGGKSPDDVFAELRKAIGK